MNWNPFWNMPVEEKPEEPRQLPSLRQVLKRIELNEQARQARDVAYRNTRRLDVSDCRKGRVCSGTFACPCKAEDHKLRDDFFGIADRVMREETQLLPPSRFTLD